VGAFIYPVTAASAASAPTASEVAAVQQEYSAVPEYSTAPAIESGRVVDSGDHPVAGATVLLYPFPLQAPKGTVVSAVSRAVTDAAGSYTLHLPATQRSALADTGTGGALNLHLMTEYPGGVGNWFFSIPSAHATAAAARITMQSAPSSSLSAAAGGTTPQTADYCRTVSQTSIGPIDEYIGYKSTLDSKTTTNFTWTKGFSETTGVGISYSGTYASVSASGSSTMASNTSETFTAIKGASSNHYQAQSRWYWTETACGNQNETTYSWTLHQYYIDGGAGTPGAPAVAAGKCVTTNGLSSVTSDNQQQTTFSGGVDAKALGFDINLNAQDGFTSDASLTYSFASGDHPPWCGVKGYPGEAANDYLQIH
jgi:hypothetical protein